MTMFASRTPRDLNRDPHPWLDPTADPRRTPFWRTSYRMTGMVYEPRPEFDHVQHNPPNPILVEVRLNCRTPEVDGWNARIAALYYIEEVLPDATYAQSVRRWTAEQIDHARRVLTRLANLTKGELTQ